ncbi:MAG: acyl carrier protein [Planctomycetota bacterium]
MTTNAEALVIEFLTRKLGAKPRPEDPIAQLGFDSLGLAESTAELEQVCKVRLGEHILDVETVGDLIELIRRQQSAVPPPHSRPSVDQSGRSSGDPLATTTGPTHRQSGDV